MLGSISFWVNHQQNHPHLFFELECFKRSRYCISGDALTLQETFQPQKSTVMMAIDASPVIGSVLDVDFSLVKASLLARVQLLFFCAFCDLCAVQHPLSSGALAFTLTLFLLFFILLDDVFVFSGLGTVAMAASASGLSAGK